MLDFALSLIEKTSTDAAKWEKGTPEDWANESHDVSRDVAYRGIPADGNPPKIDQAYLDRAGPVVERQLERGGARLAEILNQAIGR